MKVIIRQVIFLSQYKNAMAAFRIPYRFCSGKSSPQHFIESLMNIGFNQVISKINILKAEKGNCVAELKLADEHVNSIETLHGGLTATLVDCITSYALITHEKAYLRLTVSIDIQLSFFKPASVGDTIVIDAKTLRAGKTLGFTECEIRNKATGDLVAKGSHTKYIMERKS